MTPPGGRRGNGLTQTAPAPSRRLIPSSNNHQSASTATPPWVQFVRSVETQLNGMFLFKVHQARTAHTASALGNGGSPPPRIAGLRSRAQRCPEFHHVSAVGLGAVDLARHRRRSKRLTEEVRRRGLCIAVPRSSPCRSAYW